MMFVFQIQVEAEELLKFYYRKGSIQGIDFCDLNIGIVNIVCRIIHCNSVLEVTMKI